MEKDITGHHKKKFLALQPSVCIDWYHFQCEKTPGRTLGQWSAMLSPKGYLF